MQNGLVLASHTLFRMVVIITKNRGFVHVSDFAAHGRVILRGYFPNSLRSRYVVTLQMALNYVMRNGKFI